eukprot:2593880-Amphidinium_carterae.1
MNRTTKLVVAPGVCACICPGCLVFCGARSTWALAHVALLDMDPQQSCWVAGRLAKPPTS